MLLVAVIGVAIAGAGLKSGAIYADTVIDDRALAESFLRSYYAETVADPHKCCFSRLSEHYINLNHQSLTTYIAFFNTVSEVRILSVGHSSSGYFRARLRYKARNGRVTDEIDLFALHCGKQKWRWQSCSKDDIVIWDFVGDVDRSKNKR